MFNAGATTQKRAITYAAVTYFFFLPTFVVAVASTMPYIFVNAPETEQQLQINTLKYEQWPQRIVQRTYQRTNERNEIYTEFVCVCAGGRCIV